MIKKTLYGIAIICLLPISLNASKDTMKSNDTMKIRNKSNDKIKLAMNVEATHGEGTVVLTKDLEKGHLWQGSEKISSIEVSKYLKPNMYSTPVTSAVKSSTKEIHIKNNDSGSYDIQQFDQFQK